MIDQVIIEDIERIKRNVRKADFEGKKVLVTGSTGFIGSLLCDVLVCLDAEVVCLVICSSGFHCPLLFFVRENVI